MDPEGAEWKGNGEGNGNGNVSEIVIKIQIQNVQIFEKYIANPQRRFQQQTSSKSTQQIPLKFVDNHFRQKIAISVLTQSAHIIKADGT